MSERITRVNELIKEEISKIIPKEVTEPGRGIITVTRVMTSADLHYATVFVGIMSENPMVSLAMIEDARPRIQKALNSRIKMKFTPKIEFKLDHGGEHSERIERLINRIYKKQEPAKRILLIEDDPFLQSAYETQLSFAGFDVLLAETAKEALEELEDQEDLDLVILDIKLPDMDGVALMKKYMASKSDFNVPIIILTNYSKKEAEVKTKDLDAVFTWTKTESPLVETVEIIKDFLKKDKTGD